MESEIRNLIKLRGENFHNQNYDFSSIDFNFIGKVDSLQDLEEEEKLRQIRADSRNMTTPSKRNMRRSHLGLSANNFVECPNCGELKLSHHICSSCGFYNKKSIVSMKNLDENNELDSDS